MHKSRNIISLLTSLESKNGYLAIFISILYFASHIMLSVYHEPWRDEAQAWVLARDLNLLGLINQMKFEGHPALWHLILYPFAHLNFPFRTISVLNVLISTITVFLIIKKIEMPSQIKILIVFTGPFLYTYSIIARSYVLVPLLLIWIIDLYPNRQIKPIQYHFALFLLANTHIYLFGMACSFVLLSIYEAYIHKNQLKNLKRLVSAILVSSSGLILVVFQLFSSLQVSSSAPQKIQLNIIQVLSNIVYSWIDVVPKIINSKFENVSIIIFSIWALAIFIIGLKYNLKLTLVFTAGILWMFLVSAIVYGFNLHRAYFLLILLICFIWVIYKETNLKDKSGSSDVIYSWVLLSGLSIILFCNLLQVEVPILKKDMQTNYSNSFLAYSFISDFADQDVIIITTNDSLISPIVAYDSKLKIYDPVRKSFITYTIWDSIHNENISYLQFEKLLSHLKNEYKKIYIIAPNGTSNVQDFDEYIEQNNNYKVVFTAMNSIIGEDYRIYESR